MKNEDNTFMRSNDLEIISNCWELEVKLNNK